jgi:hypothetical protein
MCVVESKIHLYLVVKKSLVAPQVSTVLEVNNTTSLMLDPKLSLSFSPLAMLASPPSPIAMPTRQSGSPSPKITAQSPPTQTNLAFVLIQSRPPSYQVKTNKFTANKKQLRAQWQGNIEQVFRNDENGGEVDQLDPSEAGSSGEEEILSEESGIVSEVPSIKNCSHQEDVVKGKERFVPRSFKDDISPFCNLTGKVCLAVFKIYCLLIISFTIGHKWT